MYRTHTTLHCKRDGWCICLERSPFGDSTQLWEEEGAMAQLGMPGQFLRSNTDWSLKSLRLRLSGMKQDNFIY